jgi:hypothetical protein
VTRISAGPLPAARRRSKCAGLAIDRIAVYEIPGTWPRIGRSGGRLPHRARSRARRGRRGDTAELFMRVAGSSDEELAAVRNSPYWPAVLAAMEALAHTLAYDAACLGDGHPPLGRLANITHPTLVATGAAHPPGSAEWLLALDRAADATAASIRTRIGESWRASPMSSTRRPSPPCLWSSSGRRAPVPDLSERAGRLDPVPARPRPCGRPAARRAVPGRPGRSPRPRALRGARAQPS